MSRKAAERFGNYGANIIVAAKDGGELPLDALTNVRAIVAGQGLAAPFAYVIVKTPDGHSIVVAGTDPEQAHVAPMVVSNSVATWQKRSVSRSARGEIASRA